MTNILKFPNKLSGHRKEVAERALYNHRHLEMINKMYDGIKDKMTEMAKHINSANACFREIKSTIELLQSDASYRLENNLAKEGDVTLNNQQALNTTWKDFEDAGY